MFRIRLIESDPGLSAGSPPVRRCLHRDAAGRAVLGKCCKGRPQLLKTRNLKFGGMTPMRVAALH
jgi:hypothetical protein